MPKINHQGWRTAVKLLRDTRRLWLCEANGKIGESFANRRYVLINFVQRLRGVRTLARECRDGIMFLHRPGMGKPNLGEPRSRAAQRAVVRQRMK